MLQISCNKVGIVVQKDDTLLRMENRCIVKCMFLSGSVEWMIIVLSNVNVECFVARLTTSYTPTLSVPPHTQIF